MRGKILIILGVLIVFAAFAAYFLFDAAVDRDSELDPVGVLAARTDIPRGTIVNTLSRAQELFHVIHIHRDHLVPGAIVVPVSVPERGAGSALNKIWSYLFSPEHVFTIRDIEYLIDKRITRSYSRNEQIIITHVTDEYLDLDRETRIFALPVNFIDSVAGEVLPGNFIDVWIRYDELGDSTIPDIQNDSEPVRIEKILGPLEVLMVKSADNMQITSYTQGIPAAVIVSMTESDIALVSEKMLEGTLFLTRHEE